MLVAFAVNPDRGDQHEIVAEMQSVDLHHQQVERGQVDQIAITRASVTNWAVMAALIDHPTTSRENRSITAAT
jgi:hypothetical protein